MTEKQMACFADTVSISVVTPSEGDASTKTGVSDAFEKNTTLDRNALPEKTPQVMAPQAGCCWGRKSHPAKKGEISGICANREAVAYASDAIGRAVTYISAGAFLGSAILVLAKESVGCATEAPPGSDTVPECNERVFGVLRPSALLTTYSIAVSVLSSAFMPVVGAIIDYTPYRRALGRTIATTTCVLMIPQIFIGEKTWIMVAAIQIFLGSITWGQNTVSYAYLPELTDNVEQQRRYITTFSAIDFGSNIFNLAGTIAIASALGVADDTVATARVAQVIGVLICSVTFYLAWWRLFKPRPAMRELPPGHSLWAAGFIQVYHTVRNLSRNRPVLRWFFVNVVFVDATINSLFTLIITYLTDQLGFSSTETGVTLLCTVIGLVPGSVFCGNLIEFCKSPIISAQVAIVLLSASITTTAIVLRKSDQQLPAYLLGFAWGFSVGCKWNSDRLMASTLIPEGQDAEYMGFYLFCGQLLVWFPPLLFSVLDGHGVSQRIGIASMNLFLFFGFCALVAMGNYRAAIEKLGRMRFEASIAETDQEPLDLEDGAAEDDQVQMEPGVLVDGQQDE